MLFQKVLRLYVVYLVKKKYLVISCDPCKSKFWWVYQKVTRPKQQWCVQDSFRRVGSIFDFIHSHPDKLLVSDPNFFKLIHW